MATSYRVRRVLWSVSLTALAVLALGWLYLYLDSLHQRRKAEHLIADLKSFPFATAGFPEVRQLTNRYSGTTVQSFPLPKFLPPGPPLRKFPGRPNSEQPLPQVWTRPTCTSQDCTFDIRIEPRSWVYDLPLDYKTSAFLASVLAHVGLRPWVVAANFEVKDGKLWESRSGAGQARRRTLGSYRGVAMLGYEVISMSKPNATDQRRPDYAVCIPHITDTISEDLWTYFVQAPDAKTSRAFDIDLHCLTAITHPCTGSANWLLRLGSIIGLS
jgi:hypothetical protein